MLSLLLGSALARSLYVVDDPDEVRPFIVVDEQGDRIRAWHFAHLTRDRPMVQDLKPIMYGRRTAVTASLVGGGLAFVVGSLYVSLGRELGFGDLNVQPELAVGAGVATGGFLLVATGIAIATQRPEVLEVDTHYTEGEARARIATRARVSVGPGWVAGRF